jgi:hypothetical protein
VGRFDHLFTPRLTVPVAAAMQALRLASYTNRPTLSVIETLMMIGPYLIDSGKFIDAWALFGVTVRLAQAVNCGCPRPSSASLGCSYFQCIGIPASWGTLRQMRNPSPERLYGGGCYTRTSNTPWPWEDPSELLIWATARPSDPWFEILWLRASRTMHANLPS